MAKNNEEIRDYIIGERFGAMVRWSNIPEITYQTHRLDRFFNQENAQVRKVAEDYTEGKLEHHFITFIGEPGRGKTHLALAIGWYWLEYKELLVKYYQSETLLDELRRGFGYMDKELLCNFDKMIDSIKKVPLLIIDDLGAEYTTEWARAKLDTIIDHRYINKLHTVVTTNLSPKKLPGRLSSRLEEGTICLLKGEDYRKVKSINR